jgi:hypothetical protein
LYLEAGQDDAGGEGERAHLSSHAFYLLQQTSQPLADDKLHRYPPTLRLGRMMLYEKGQKTFFTQHERITDQQ